MLRSFCSFGGASSPSRVIHWGLSASRVTRSISRFKVTPLSPLQLSSWGNDYIKSSRLDRITMQQELLTCDPTFKITDVMLKRSPQGIELALSLRGDINYCVKNADKGSGNSLNMDLKPLWKEFDQYLKGWLGAVFCESVLEVREINMNETSGEALEYVVSTEAVHPIKTVADMKHRFGDGRRCFGLFMNSSAYRVPLAYIHVGLLDEFAASLRTVLDAKESSAPQYAIFYSVNSPHAGLGGLDMASILIKRVCGHLAARYPSLHTYSTLSPIPGFCRWCKDLIASNGQSSDIYDFKTLVNCIPQSVDMNAVGGLFEIKSGDEVNSNLNIVLQVLEFLQSATTENVDEWLARFNGLCQTDSFQELADYLVLYYLSMEVHGRSTGHLTLRLPLDPVARFHIRNGGMIRRLNCLGNPSDYGAETSATYMVNYLYYEKQSPGELTTGQVISFAQENAIAEFVNSHGYDIPHHPSVKKIT